MKGSKMQVDDYCGNCYFYQKLEIEDADAGVCQYCNQTKRNESKACNKWLGKKIGG
jgi:hypothetical protein